DRSEATRGPQKTVTPSCRVRIPSRDLAVGVDPPRLADRDRTRNIERREAPAGITKKAVVDVIEGPELSHDLAGLVGSIGRGEFSPWNIDDGEAPRGQAKAVYSAA